ncbi:hypothetical protein ACFRU3_39220 [Streptomyces sp. NPDC056910]|uniref:hypothetical protein n=1 Tax=Streptomyces sp. NPDC056910 TaxID=3345964 RepID=UPI00369CF04D
MNWIGPEFAAIGAYICWRDSRAEAKTDFAPQSPIRQWPDYSSRPRLHDNPVADRERASSSAY